MSTSRTENDSAAVLAADHDELPHFLDGLERAYRHHLVWLLDLYGALVFNHGGRKAHPQTQDRCALCRFLNSIDDENIGADHDVKRLRAKHKDIHRGARDLLQAKTTGSGTEKVYDQFKRAVLRQAHLVDRLKLRSTFSIAHTDSLTGLQTRDIMEQHIKRELSRAERSGTAFSIALCDLDHFKRVNDQHGHQAGDIVLAGIAQLIEDSLRAYDEAFRYGGEEFLLLLPETDKADAVAVVERLRKDIEAASFDADGTRLQITMSFGVAEFAPGKDSPALISEADKKLYLAKKSGRNRVEA